MPILAMSAGTVTAVWGNAYVRLPDGSLKPVHVGDKVVGGERILTEENGIVEISPAKGRAVLVKAAPAPEAVTKVIAGIEGQDPDQAPGAGVTGGPDGGMQPGLRVDRVSEAVGAQSFDFAPGGAAAPALLAGSSADQRPLVSQLPGAQPSAVPGAGAQASIDDLSINEGAGVATFTVTLSQAASTVVTVNYATQQGSARDADFTSKAGTLTFQPGETSKTISVPITNDGTYEGGETFNVVLSQPVNATLGKDSGQAVIHDDGTGSVPAGVALDDDRPKVASVSDARADEGGTLDFHVKLTHDSTTPTTLTLKLAGTGQYPAQLDADIGEVTVSLGDGTGLPATIDAQGNITFDVPAFTPASTDIVVHVKTLTDALPESAETLQLSVATPYDTSPVAGIGTIVNPPPYMLVREGEPGVEGEPIGFNVVLTHASPTAVTVGLSLLPGADDPDTLANESAKPGLDTGTQLEYETADGNWVAVTGPLTFAPGETLIHVRVASIDDGLAEDTEFIKLQATVLSGDTANQSHANQTAIVDNDTVPSVIEPLHARVSSIDTNLLIVLDTSGSMNADSGIDHATRLQAAIEAIDKMLDRYDQYGNVAVRLVTFASEAEAHGDAWLSVHDAKEVLASLDVSGNGGTFYNKALSTAEQAYDTQAGKLADAQNVAYFLSDGIPTHPITGQTVPRDGMLSAEQELAWQRFAEVNAIKSHAIGMGADVSKVYLDGIALDGHAGANTDGVVVSDFGQLDAVLGGTTQDVVAGTLSVSSSMGMPGDQFDHVGSITVDGVTHVYDSAATSLTLTTQLGGVLTMDMATGAYSYAAPATAVEGLSTETIGFTLVGQQQTASSTLDIQVDHTHVITWRDGAGGSLAGMDSSDLIMGWTGNDTLTGGAGADQLYGHGGRDDLRGDQGDDLLQGGQGDDILTGGSGADVFAWHLSDQGSAAAPAVDVIKDFNANAPGAGGDVLDLRDLLQGEHTDGGIGNLAQYLRFESTEAGTVIQIAPQGSFVPGDAASSGTSTQHIVLEGVDLRQDMALDAAAPDAQIISALLQQNKLLVDHA